MATTLVIRSATPKIDGSAVGFIVLVVCLVIIIVSASLAILYLIRDERSQGIFRFTHRRQQRSTSSTPFIHNTSSDHHHPWSWRKRILNFFHHRSGSNDSAVDGRAGTAQEGHRWYQSGSGDSWDNTVPRLMEARSVPLESYLYSTSPPPLPEMNLPNPYGRRSLIYNHDSSGSSVHLDLSDPRKLSSPAFSQSNRIFPSDLDLHRVVSSPPPGSSTLVLASSSSLRSESPIPRRAVSPGPEPISPPGIALRTFEGGSKFLEAI